MIEAINTAVSGLRAASLRVTMAAENIAAAGVTGSADPAAYDGYVPQRVVQTTGAGGATIASAVAVDPAFLTIFDQNDPNADADGRVGVPNVDLATEIVELTLAEHAYKANLAVIRAADEITEALLDTTA